MYSKEFLASFIDDLTARQNELRNECITNDIDNEAFARACSEILCESGMFVEEPEFLMIDDSGYRLDAVCWPDEEQPIVEFLLFVRKMSEETWQNDVIKAFEKNIVVLRTLCMPVGRKTPNSIEIVIHRVLSLIPCPESILVRIVTDASVDNPNLESKLRNSLRKRLPNEIYTDFKLCDIKDLCQNSDGGTRGPSREFGTVGNEVIPCFLAHSMIDHDVYLASFPGRILAAAYREYGQRLLQKNVRAFLGFKGKKNKNIARSLVETPQKFLAYNNGLTITANNIEVTDDFKLIKIDDMQIVNGGQTIAVLADAYKQNDPLCLETVMVAAKIIHVKNENEHTTWIEKIAETSNTQNAIKDADLSSHNPIYLKIKALSGSTVFRKGAEQFKWYFSRVRNEYKTELDQHKKRGRIALKQFEKMYPKENIIEKAIIARVETVFSGKPWFASRGEAKCHVNFMESLPSDFVPDIDWYRSLIGKILLIKNADKLAKMLGIREGRSCIVEYSCALLGLEDNFQFFIDKISKTQDCSADLDTKLKLYIEKVRKEFTKLDQNRSTKEHAKREGTWSLIRSKVTGLG